MRESESELVGPQLRKLLLERIEAVAVTDHPVLISGATGTGKEIIAKYIHTHSLRRDKKFILVDFSEIRPQILESEVFGHVRGAFTSAASSRKGLIEEGEKGTVFMDEFDKIDPHYQNKLLRFLNTGHVRPVGGNVYKPINTRVIIGIGSDLEKQLEQGTVTPDMYHRIARAHRINLPVLDERHDDIVPLFEHFFISARTESLKDTPVIDKDLGSFLSKYDWPGNVRQLENFAIHIATWLPSGCLRLGRQVLVSMLSILDPDKRMIVEQCQRQVRSLQEPAFMERWNRVMTNIKGAGITKLTNKAYRTHCRELGYAISTSSALRDLRKMCRNNQLKRVGQTKGVVYHVI